MSSDTLFPVVDLTPLLLADESLLLRDPAALAASKQIAASLVATGCVLVRDPRVSERDNSRFLDLLERYFEQPEDSKKRDARPELHYQVGATPEGIERPSLLREDSTSAASPAMSAMTVCAVCSASWPAIAAATSGDAPIVRSTALVPVRYTPPAARRTGMIRRTTARHGMDDRRRPL